MIIVSAPFITRIPPRTDIAMANRIRVCAAGLSGSDRRFKLGFDPAVIGTKICRPEALRLEVGPWVDDMHIHRIAAL